MKRRTVFIGIACLAVVMVLVYLFVPRHTQSSVTQPAMIFQRGESDGERTALTIDGTWTHSRAIPSRQSFTGAIQVEALEYTHKENSWELDFRIFPNTAALPEGYLMGGIFYNSTGRFEGHGWLYTDPNHDCYVLVTNRFDSETEDWVVIAPAETEEEARAICNAMELGILAKAE